MFFRSTRKASDRKSDKSARALRSRKSLRFESLEERRVMDGSGAVTDMTALATMFSQKRDTTMLYLNFDGDSSGGVGMFNSVNREDDIQEVLFRTSEIFAPFNVAVSRYFGNGNKDLSGHKNTTIFVGDHPRYTNTRNGVTTNDTGGFTPWTSTDYSTNITGLNHAHNGNPNDVAFVDPMAISRGVDIVFAGAEWTARTIAHEAGHTFGLAHVLSAPSQDAMSYDSANVAFLNTTFNTTNLNYNPATGTTAPDDNVMPKWRYLDSLGRWRTSVITTQNSFTTLNWALGSRSNAGDVANLVHTNYVTPGHVDGTMVPLAVKSSNLATIGRRGDYDVYSFTPTSTGTIRVEVNGMNGSFVNPSILVYNASTGRALEIASDTDYDGKLETSLNVTAGSNYRIVVGDADSNTTGQYEVSLEAGPTGPRDAILNMSSLLGAANGIADRIKLVSDGTSASSHVSMFVNDKLVWTERFGDLNSIRVNGTSDIETFQLQGTFPVQVKLYGYAGADTLIGPDVSASWRVEGYNSGKITGTGADILFNSFENLTGGAQHDTFFFTDNASVTGQVKGGAGTNALNYQSLSTAVNVDLVLGQATKTGGIASIRDVAGGAGNDTIRGDSLGNTLNGWLGNDTLYGGSGNDTLYGSTGADKLYGEAGADFLDGGLDRAIDLLVGDIEGATDEVDIFVSGYMFDNSVYEAENFIRRPFDKVAPHRYRLY